MIKGKHRGADSLCSLVPLPKVCAHGYAFGKTENLTNGCSTREEHLINVLKGLGIISSIAEIKTDTTFSPEN